MKNRSANGTEKNKNYEINGIFVCFLLGFSPACGI
jgi:hypothetical protein